MYSTKDFYKNATKTISQAGTQWHGRQTPQLAHRDGHVDSKVAIVCETLEKRNVES